MGRISGTLPEVCQLPKHYALDISSDHDSCVHCGGPLRRVRTSRHIAVGLMLGRPSIRLIHRQCVQCGQRDSMDTFHRLVPSHGNYAFDLMVEAGLARLRDNRQNAEIQALLEQRWGLSVPASSISLLVDSFLDGLAAIHQARTPLLREKLRNDGGYALHVDGTCELNSSVLFIAMAEPHHWVLESAKMTTENTEDVGRLLHRCVLGFGQPLVIVRDLSAQIAGATAEAVPGVTNLICQYHFLENVGENLCEKPHAMLTKDLRRVRIRQAFKALRCDILRGSKTRMCASQVEALLTKPSDLANLDPVSVRRFLGYILLRWLDDYGSDLKGEYFPFDLPSLAFYRRARELSQLLETVFSSVNLPSRDTAILGTMARHLANLRDDTELVQNAQRLEDAAALFGELRSVLRLTSRPRERLLRGQVPCGAESRETTEQCRKNLEIWRECVRERIRRESDIQRRANLETVLKYLEKYDGQLSGHVIWREAYPPFVVARTNNTAEHLFSVTKRGLRRRVGAKKLTRIVDATRPESLLVHNLTDPIYVRLVVGGSLDDLAPAIGGHWPLALEIRRQRASESTTHAIPTTKKQLRRETLLETLAKAAEATIGKQSKEGQAA